MAHRAARALALLACAMGALPPLALEASAQPRAQRPSLTQLERNRAEAAAEAQRLERDARAAQTRIRELGAQLAETGRRRTEAEAAAAEAETRLAALKLQLDEDGAVYARDRETLEDLLITAAFAERRGGRAAIRARMFAQAAAPSVTRRLDQRGRAIADARMLAGEIESEQMRLAGAQLAIEAERTATVTLISQQRALRATLTANAAEAQRRAQRFAREARNLRDLTTRATASAPRPAAPRSAVLPANWVAPASGRIVRAYGSREGAGAAAQGATLRTRPGAQVVAPAAGEVAYAGAFRGYGNVLILNVAGGYALVLTGMEDLRARAGDTVSAGQPIGDMSATAAGSDTPAPELYVEVRRDGRPVDPGRWLAARGVTVAQAN